MSVNLKGRKSAKNEQQDAPAPELVMAGGQTPWAGQLPPAADSPFAGAPQGMPGLPPPPPSYAPGQEPTADADAPAGRKAPSRNVILAAAAVLVLGGVGYFYLNSGSSSPTPAPLVHHVVPVPGSPAAKAAAARLAAARAAAAAAAAKPGAAKAGTKPLTTKPAAGKGTTPKTAAGGGAPAKAVTTPGKPNPTVSAAAAKPGTTAAAGTTATKPAAPAFTFTAALPGQIGLWARVSNPALDKLTAQIKAATANTGTGFQAGFFGNTAADPYLFVGTGDVPAAAQDVPTAMQLAKEGAVVFRSDGAAVAAPVPVPHTPWGGTAACGTYAQNDVLYVYCAWVDHNTFGYVFAPNRTQSQALPILNMARAAVEH